MKKLPIAVAVAGALAAPAIAFAQATNVQLFGSLNLKVMNNRFSDGTTSAPPNATGGGYNPSVTHWQLQSPGNAWGVRGSEDLGGGLTAFFQLQATLALDRRPQSVDSNSGIFGGNPTWLGLRGSWGEVKGGNLDMPYKLAAANWNVGVLDQTMGVIMGGSDTKGGMPSPNCGGLLSSTGLTNVFAVPAGGTTATNAQRVCTPSVEANSTAFARMASNSIQYESPNLSGFVIQVATQIAENKEATVPLAAGTTTPIAGVGKNDPSLMSTAVSWSGGPFRVGAAYEQHKGFTATNVANSNRNAKDSAWQFGGMWNFGPGAVGLGFDRLDYGNFAVAGAENNYKLNNWIVTGRWSVTPAGQVSGSYASTAGRKSCGVALVCNDTGAKMWTIGYSHSLSKRTSLYALYTKIDNEKNANYYWFEGPEGNNVNGPNATSSNQTQNATNGGIGAGVDVSSWGVGVRHTF